jgi:hypothetical protein
VIVPSTTRMRGRGKGRGAGGALRRENRGGRGKWCGGSGRRLLNGVAEGSGRRGVSGVSDPMEEGEGRRRGGAGAVIGHSTPACGRRARVGGAAPSRGGGGR